MSLSWNPKPQRRRSKRPRCQELRASARLLLGWNNQFWFLREWPGLGNPAHGPRTGCGDIASTKTVGVHGSSTAWLAVFVSVDSCPVSIRIHYQTTHTKRNENRDPENGGSHSLRTKLPRVSALKFVGAAGSLGDISAARDGLMKPKHSK